MNADNDNKFNNPFINLDGKIFSKEDTVEENQELDKEIFLAAMAKPLVKNKKFSGFKLSEQCALPQKINKAVKKTEPVRRQEVPKEEENEFLLAMRNIEPLKKGGRRIIPEVKNMGANNLHTQDFADMLEENLEFALLFSDEYLEGRVAGLDDALMNRLRNGQFSPEAHLDLHGLNSMQAFEALREFIKTSWFKGLRVVLLVPGRGLNSPNGRSILRQKLQTWLTQEPFKRVVLAFCTARPHDGGPGSIYTLLRKYRKKGRIHWDRLPADADLYNYQ